MQKSELKPRVKLTRPEEATHFVFVHESLLSSWLKDAGSLGALAALIYVNHTYGGHSWAVDVTGVVLFWVFMLHRASKQASLTRITRAELRAWALNLTKGD